MRHNQPILPKNDSGNILWLRNGVEIEQNVWIESKIYDLRNFLKEGETFFNIDRSIHASTPM